MSLLSTTSDTMKFFAFLLCASLSTAAVVKREADADAAPDADVDADPGYGRHRGGYSSTPVCTLTPVLRSATPGRWRTPGRFARQCWTCTRTPW